MRHSWRYDFQGHLRSRSRSGDDLSTLSGLFLYIGIGPMVPIISVSSSSVIKVWVFGTSVFKSKLDLNFTNLKLDSRYNLQRHNITTCVCVLKLWSACIGTVELSVFMTCCQIYPLLSNHMYPAGKQLLALAFLLLVRHRVMTGGLVGNSASVWCRCVKFHWDRPTSSQLLN